MRRALPTCRAYAVEDCIELSSWCKIDAAAEAFGRGRGRVGGGGGGGKLLYSVSCSYRGFRVRTKIVFATLARFVARRERVLGSFVDFSSCDLFVPSVSTL